MLLRAYVNDSTMQNPIGEADFHGFCIVTVKVLNSYRKGKLRMIETIASVGLPVDEVLRIKKNRITPSEMREDMPRISVVTGIHGDELEGQYICYELQRRIRENKECLTGNVDFIWVHGASTVLESTFAYSLNHIGTPVLVVEMGVGMRITRTYGDQMVDGILNLMKKLGIWSGEVPDPRKPILSRDPEDVSYLNARVSGIFIPSVKHWMELKKGDRIGQIVDPLGGTVLDEVTAPVDGILFTIRDYPVVGEGSLMGRLLRKEAYSHA